MEQDTGKTAMWLCSAMLGLLRAKGIVHDEEIAALADAMETSAGTGEPAVDMLSAAEWLRGSIAAASD